MYFGLETICSCIYYCVHDFLNQGIFFFALRINCMHTLALIVNSTQFMVSMHTKACSSKWKYGSANIYCIGKFGIRKRKACVLSLFIGSFDCRLYNTLTFATYIFFSSRYLVNSSIIKNFRGRVQFHATKFVRCIYVVICTHGIALK